MISFSFCKDKRNSDHIEITRNPNYANSFGHVFLQAAIFIGFIFAIFYLATIISSLTPLLKNQATAPSENWPVAISPSKNEGRGFQDYPLADSSSDSFSSSQVIDDLIRRVESLEKTEDRLNSFKELVFAQFQRSQAIRLIKLAFRAIEKPTQKLRLVFLSPRRKRKLSDFGLEAIHSVYSKMVGKDPAGLLGEQTESPPLCSAKGRVRVIYQAKADLRLSLLRLKLPGVA